MTDEEIAQLLRISDEPLRQVAADRLDALAAAQKRIAGLEAALKRAHAPWLSHHKEGQPGRLQDCAAEIGKAAIDAINASGTHCVLPWKPTAAMVNVLDAAVQYGDPYDDYAAERVWDAVRDAYLNGQK